MIQYPICTFSALCGKPRIYDALCSFYNFGSIKNLNVSVSHYEYIVAVLCQFLFLLKLGIYIHKKEKHSTPD